ncbi:MAG: YggS family pyridoxal phosphate-dependent enzyme [Bacteroidota bacterium]
MQHFAQSQADHIPLTDAIFMFKELLTKLSAAQVQLIAVSKTYPPARIQEFYDLGQRAFAENRVQEMLDKYAALPKDIEWHLIGHLQTNKVRYIAPFVHLIHSVDSLRLLQEIDIQAAKNDRVIDCLLQFHIAKEDTKFGLDEAEATEILQSDAFKKMAHVRLCGVMGMASFTDDHETVRQEFKQLKSIFNGLKQQFFADQPAFKEISMGMSGDWETAVSEGSTMVRIGSLIFGNRS